MRAMPVMPMVGGVFVVILLLAFLALVIAGFFMWIAAKMAGVENSTFGRALLAAVASVFVSWFVAGLSWGLFRPRGLMLGWAVGVLASMFVIKEVFNTTFGKAFLVWVFHLLAEVLALIIGFLTFAAALFRLHR